MAEKGQVAKLAHDWVYALTFVRTRLRVAESLCWSVAALTVT